MKKIFISILIIILIIAIFIAVKWGIAYANDNTEPIIYYSFNDNPNLPLDEENTVFSNNISIMWTNNCKGIIKKDGKTLSKRNGTLLSNEGTYEIIVHSPSWRNKTVRILRVDKTPPKVELKKTISGTYNIIFSEPTDVQEAILLRFDSATNELISKTNLVEDGMKESVEVTQKGYYVLSVSDRHGNSTESIEFDIE